MDVQNTGAKCCMSILIVSPFLPLPQFASLTLPLICVQRDFDLREMREFNKTIVKQIGEAVNQHPEMSEAVNMYFAQVCTFSLCAFGRWERQGRGDHLSGIYIVRGTSVSISAREQRWFSHQGGVLSGSSLNRVVSHQGGVLSG